MSRSRGIVTGLVGIAVMTLPLIGSAQERPERINGHPNLNGIWQAMGTAHWNLEAHSAEALDEFWRLGSLAAIPAGRSVVGGGTIPYLPEALAQRDANRAGWPKSDPEAACYLPGIPRATYMPYPFEIIQGDDDIFMVYAYASANRTIHIVNPRTYEEVPVDTWMGWSNGRWEGDTLVVETIAQDERTWLDRAGNHHSYMMTVTERFTPMTDYHIQYEATIDDPLVYSEPWTIRMPLYRDVAESAELLDFKCVEFSENLLYGEYLLNPPD
ncbi:MAG TPA: hypothetical protein VMR74_08635 [Gammaproteobacteria bacterium]|nr:hypothetical protein [Gammaproteobacteria bacterium]